MFYAFVAVMLLYSKCCDADLCLFAMFDFGQVFIFCRIINKNVLKWFQPMCKEHTLIRSVNTLSRNHLTLCF